MKYLLPLLALLFLVPIQAQATDPYQLTVRIVYVQPEGETFTKEEQAHARESVQAGATWWNELSPITTTLTVEDAGFVTTTTDVYTDPSGLTRTAGYTPTEGTVLLFMVDNTTSGRLFQNGRNGLAYYRNPYGIIWLVPYAGPAVAAHELGHALYDLTDLMGNQVDIMSHTLRLAYQARFIGWTSLHQLGVEPRQTYLPIVGR